jgi:pyruvate/2-oxoglutarate dehydrogenase complex dihydrolipoamide dehydrogenase (E3) component
VPADLSVLVVGGGPAGITAAPQARELGADVTMLEAGHVGDSTLKGGPAPVRTLARAARLARDWSSLAKFGLTGPRPVPGLPIMVANSERVAQHARRTRDAVRGGAIAVDECMRTSAPHIFAAGDVTGPAMLVQTARMEGRLAAKNAVLGSAQQASYEVIPSGSFTDPEYGRVGLTEADAAHRGDVVVGLARYRQLLRPVADGRADRFCKLVVDHGSHLLPGAHALGEYAAETVQTVAACMAAGLTVEQVAELEFAFPTFTEGVSMAAQMACRDIGAGRFPRVWSYLGAEDGGD